MQPIGIRRRHHHRRLKKQKRNITNNNRRNISMKKLSIIFAMLAMVAFVSNATAQERNKYNPNYPEDFTKDQADSTISARNKEISSLQDELNPTNSSITKANADLQQRMADNDKCKNDLYALC